MLSLLQLAQQAIEVALKMENNRDGSRGGDSSSRDNNHGSDQDSKTTTSRKRSRRLTRITPIEGKKRVNYSKGDARRIMEEAVSLCEAMALGYEVVFHGRRRTYTAPRSSILGGARYERVESSSVICSDGLDIKL